MSLSKMMKYELGFVVGGVKLPDPSGFDVQIQDLDSPDSERDIGNGLLHRDRITTKINCTISWDALNAELAQSIIQAVSADQFQFTFPDPRNFAETYTGTYYAGDKSFNVLWFPPDFPDEVVYTSLSIPFVEY